MSKKIAGFSIEHNDGLLIPYYIANEDTKKEILTREALFSFPLATAGWFVGGPIGVATGHILGAAVGYLRHKRIEDV